MNDVGKQVEAVMKRIVIPVQQELVRATALRALSGIEQATPVDSGRARSNWNISSGVPDMETSERTEPRDQTGAINAAPADKTIFISNGLPYIERLNEGYSKQAGANFVEEAVQLAKNNAARGFKRPGGNV